MKQFVSILLSLFVMALHANAQYDVSLDFDKAEKCLVLNVRNNTDRIYTFRPKTDQKEDCSYVSVIYKDKNDKVLDKSEWLIYEFLHKGEYRAGQYLFEYENKRYNYRIGGKRKGIHKVEVFVQVEARDIRELSKFYRKELRQEYLWK